MKYVPGNEPPEPIARPRCPNCGGRLRPYLAWDYVKGSTQRTPASWTGRYHGYGAFCTLRCCDQFANAAYMAGFRRNG